MPLAWLLARMRKEQPPVGDCIAVRLSDAGDICIAVEDADGMHELLSMPLHSDWMAEASHSVEGIGHNIEIAPGLCLQPADPARLTQFLGDQWLALDHLDINFSHREIAEPVWQSFIAGLGALVPAYRLDIGSANDIVFVVLENTGLSNAAVVELVYDRAAVRSNAHFCVRVAADRSAIERDFAAPRGGYKPGDAAFFRSVALPPLLALPTYVDLAFSDATIAPWPQTVRAIGRRI